MARKSFVDILSIISGRYAPDRLRTIDSSVLEPKARVVSNVDRQKLLRRAVQTIADPKASGMSFGEYLNTMSQEVAATRVENDRIRKMAPEISQAASIMIPSIMSPNDMVDSKLSFSVNATCLTPMQNEKVAELISTYFNDNLHLSTALPRWIDEALYRSGAKPLMLIPLTSLEEQFVDVNLLNGSFESYTHHSRKIDGHNLYGFSDPLPGTATDRVQSELSQLIAATESFVDTTLSDLEIDNLDVSLNARPYDRSDDKNNDDRSNKYRDLVKSIVSTEALTVTDNHNTLRTSPVRNKKATDTITEKAKARFAPADVITIHAPTARDKPLGNPIFMELPTESVIPLYTPGTPNDHIGYFVLLDDRGHPLNIADYNQASVHAAQDLPNQNNFKQLFQAYGYSNVPTGDQRCQDAVASVYQTVVEQHLKQRAQTAGFADVGLGTNSSMFRYMFTRYLQQRRTKVLFVPKELLTYFCFKSDENGIGVSKLDDLKFILSLRITLMTCRMLAAFNGAINRRRIDIQFDQNFIGDALEHMMTIQREAIRKNAITFTHDPLNVAQQVANKSFTVKASGIPGLPEYNVTNESNDQTASNFDEQLYEDIKKMVILDLDVPGAAMNAVGEDEYARSVATSNIVFSRKVVGLQGITCKHTDEFTQAYVTYSSELRQKIMSIARGSIHNDPEVKTGERGDVVEQKDSKTNPTLEAIIPHIHLHLPSPNVAPDMAQFESLEKLVTSIDTMLQSLIPEDAAGDDLENQKTLSAIRAVAKADIVRKLIKDVGFNTLDLPNVNSFKSESLLKMRQIVNNLTVGLKAQLAATKPAEEMPGDQFADPAADPDSTSDPNQTAPSF